MAPAMADARGHAELGGTAREERPAGAEDGGSSRQRERQTAACAAPASRGTAPRPRGEAEGGAESSDQEQLPLPPHVWSFSNPAFGLVYLGQGERNLGNLLKKLGIGIHIPSLLELFFGGF